jgi:hypothetical protein
MENRAIDAQPTPSTDPIPSEAMMDSQTLLTPWAPESDAPSSALERLATLLVQAQTLLANPPMSRTAYAEWRTSAHDILTLCWGPTAAVTRSVHDRGNLPTNFFGASMEQVTSRLDAERQTRMTAMKATIESWRARSEAGEQGAR